MISLRRDKWPQTSTFPLQYYSTNLAIITVIRTPFTMTAYHDLETYFFNPQGKLIEVLSSLSVSCLLVSFMSLCSLPMSMSLELSKQVLFSNCDLSNSHLVPTATQNLISKQDELREALHRSFTCHPRYQKSHKPGPLHQWWTALYGTLLCIETSRVLLMSESVSSLWLHVNPPRPVTVRVGLLRNILFLIMLLLCHLARHVMWNLMGNGCQDSSIFLFIRGFMWFSCF